MLRARRIIVHMFSGKDQKTWRALEDGHTMVICIDKLLHPKLDVLDDNMFLFLMKLASTGSLQAIIGGPPCRTISSCRYADDEGPKPVRSEQEPYGLTSLTSQQREWVEDDIAMFFRMKLLYMIAESYKPRWCEKVLFGLEQPQDPKEYRPQAEVEQRQYMSVWRMDSWQRFQEKYALQLTSFEQGAFGHAKVKPTTFAHNIDGMETLEGAKASREGIDHGWKDRPLQERMAETATWAEWAPGFKMALVEALRRNFQKFDAGSCYLRALGNAEEATRDSESRSAPPEDIPLPSLDEAVEEDGLCADMEDAELPRLEVDEDEQPAEVDERAINQARASYDSWMKLVEDCKQVKVKTLTFVEVISSRTAADVMDGIARIYSRVRSLGLPVLRLHADRAKEFTSRPVQRWCNHRGIVTTYTSG
eukprot:s1603_g16.t1